MTNPETEPSYDPKKVAMSILLGHSHPEKRSPDDISGYYLDYFEHDMYPNGAVVAVHWRIEPDGTTTKEEPIHAYELAERMMVEIGYSDEQLPEVAYFLFEAVKGSAKSR